MYTHLIGLITWIRTCPIKYKKDKKKRREMREEEDVITM
jgi:hypothetical protein